VGCEIDAVFDPALDESQFAGLIGPKAKSIVRRQPTISELVCGSMSSLLPAIPNEATGGMAVYVMEHNSAARDLDFQHFQSASGIDIDKSRGDARDAPKIAAKETGKRKATFEDAFTDFEFDDDFEFDETELKELDQLEAPEKLANGNYKCNHQCKDKTKYSISTRTPLNRDRCRHLCCKEGKASSKTKSRATKSKSRKATISPPSKVTTKEAKTVDRTQVTKRHRLSDVSAETVKFTGRTGNKIDSVAPTRGRVETISQRRATWGANKEIGLDSDNDLPPLKELFATRVRKELSAGQTTSDSNQAFPGRFVLVQQNRESNPLETGSNPKSNGKECEVLGDFSADVVMENVEILL